MVRTLKRCYFTALILWNISSVFEYGSALVSNRPSQISTVFLSIDDFDQRSSQLIHEKSDQEVTDADSEQGNNKQGEMSIPIVINTWDFTEANIRAWDHLAGGGSALDAVEVGATICEELQCDNTVGFGGSPDENGETTLDAMIMDGETHAAGAVGCLRRIKNAVKVARRVMEHTGHTLLVGESATEFALKMGFVEENLTTEVSAKMHSDWKKVNCQPNFWRNVTPNPNGSCGPYSIPQKKASNESVTQPISRVIDRFNHDTIGIIAVDSLGRIASATSSNGARNKIPGRVGDAPIVGAGSYVDKEIGGAAATGDGDIMVRFLPSFFAVEQMRRGLSPQDAATEAISRIVKRYPNFSGALVAANLKGEYGAACHGLPQGFPYCVSHAGNKNMTLHIVQCT